MGSVSVSIVVGFEVFMIDYDRDHKPAVKLDLKYGKLRRVHFERSKYCRHFADQPADHPQSRNHSFSSLN